MACPVPQAVGRYIDDRADTGDMPSCNRDSLKLLDKHSLCELHVCSVQPRSARLESEIADRKQQRHVILHKTREENDTRKEPALAHGEV
jgi:hypothetical protein